MHASSIFLGVCNGKVNFEFRETDGRACWHSHNWGEGGSSHWDSTGQGEAK